MDENEKKTDTENERRILTSKDKNKRTEESKEVARGQLTYIRQLLYT